MSGDPSYLDEENGIYFGRIVGGLVWPSENPAAVVVVAILGCVGVGIFPQVLAPYAVRLADAYTFFIP